jgi:predicted ribosome quality control (RQC) complex YloA/Tae2 family protein
MNLAFEELQDVVDELDAVATGGIVQEVRQPTATAVCLSIRQPGRTLMLLFETAPRLARTHLTERRPDTLTPIPAFCAKLRKELVGIRLASTEMPWPDRVVLFRFSTSRRVSSTSHRGTADPTALAASEADAAPMEPVDGEETLLVFEGSGHHSNLFLTDGRCNILAALRPSGSHVRDLRPGTQYRPPAGPGPGGGGKDGKNRTNGTNRPRRHGKQEEAFATDLAEREPEREGVSARIDRRYSEEAERLAAEAERVRLESHLRAQRKKVEKTLARLDEDEAKVRAGDRFRLFGELLKINLHQLRRGMERVVLSNLYSEAGEPVEIPLDPALGPRENMEKLFARYRKGVRGLPKIRARREEMLKKLGEIEGGLASLGEMPPPLGAGPLAPPPRGENPGEMPPPLGAGPLAPPPRGAAAVPTADVPPSLRPPPSGEARRGDLASALRPPPSGEARRGDLASGRLPYRRFESATGRPILVGREGKDNHALTFQVASPHDVWLHVRGFPGCHVVVPLARGQEPDTETLLDAAHLAVHYSKAPKAGFVEVMWTRRKHVRAVKKGRPGQVLVEGDRTVSFHSDPARVERLLAGRSSD